MQRWRERLAGAPVYLFLVVVAASAIFPVYWLIITSVKQQRDWASNPPIFWPSTFTVTNFAALLQDTLVRHYMVNSALVTAITTVAATLIGAMAAYPLARLQLPFRLNRLLLVLILVTRLFPAVTLAIPYFLLMRTLHLVDTLLALVLTNIALAFPFVVWMMVGFYQELPMDIERAAMVDGCGLVERFRRVVLPLSRVSLAVTTAFVFIGAWNEFFYAITLTSVKAKTLPVAVGSFVTDKGILWGPMSALSVMSILPVLLFALAIQKYLVRGLTFGAVKE